MSEKKMTLGELDRWFRDPGDLEVWEDIASWFHTETGHLRPGKDKPIGFHDTPEGASDCCLDAWLMWTRDKHQEAVLGLRAELTRLQTENAFKDRRIAELDEIRGRFDKFCSALEKLLPQAEARTGLLGCVAELNATVSAQAKRILELEGKNV